MVKNCETSDLEKGEAYLAVKPGTAYDWFHKFTPSCTFPEDIKLVSATDLAKVYVGNVALDWGKLASLGLASLLVGALALVMFLVLRAGHAARLVNVV